MSEEEEEDDDYPDFSKDPTCQHTWFVTTAVCVCPKCEKKNYFQLSDRYDIEVVECWNCNTKAWVNSDTRDEAQLMYDCMDGAMSEKGEEKP